MKRFKLSRKGSQKNFRSGVKVKSKNFAVPMRGGFRI